MEDNIITGWIYSGVVYFYDYIENLIDVIRIGSEG